MSIPRIDLATFAVLVKWNPKNVLNRLKALDMAPTCTRCGGTGRYSFNPMDGDRCYGCGGAGAVLPILTRKLVDKVNAAVAAGGLDAYLADVMARSDARKIVEGFDKAFTELALVCAFSQEDLKHGWLMAAQYRKGKSSSKLYDAIHTIRTSTVKAMSDTPDIKAKAEIATNALAAMRSASDQAMMLYLNGD